VLENYSQSILQIELSPILTGSLSIRYEKENRDGICFSSLLHISPRIETILSRSNLIILKLQMHQVMRMMSLRDICNFGTTSKRMLLAAHTDKLWAILYYERCRVPNSVLYITDRPGPLRVRTSVGMDQNKFYAFYSTVVIRNEDNQGQE
jgi:hypothetical protein